jgi:hypothetical protein
MKRVFHRKEDRQGGEIKDEWKQGVKVDGGVGGGM